LCSIYFIGYSATVTPYIVPTSIDGIHLRCAYHVLTYSLPFYSTTGDPYPDPHSILHYVYHNIWVIHHYNYRDHSITGAISTTFWPHYITCHSTVHLHFHCPTAYLPVPFWVHSTVDSTPYHVSIPLSISTFHYLFTYHSHFVQFPLQLYRVLQFYFDIRFLFTSLHSGLTCSYTLYVVFLSHLHSTIPTIDFTLQDFLPDYIVLYAYSYRTFTTSTYLWNFVLPPLCSIHSTYIRFVCEDLLHCSLFRLPLPDTIYSYLLISVCLLPVHYLPLDFVIYFFVSFILCCSIFIPLPFDLHDY